MIHLFSLGNNLAAQLGVGYSIGESHSLNHIKFPVEFEGNKGMDDCNQMKVATGTLHTLVLHRNKLFSFGCNDEKALGRDGDEEYPGQITLPFFAQKIAKNTEIKKNKKNTEIRKNIENLKNNKNLANIKDLENKGLDKEAEIAQNDQIVDMGCGQSSSFVLTKSGLLYGWGMFRDSSGPIGFLIPEYLMKSKTPTSSSSRRIAKGKKVPLKLKASTINETVQPQSVLTANKIPRSIGKLICENYPVKYPVLLSKNVQAMSVGANHVIYKKADGIYSIGNNLHGEKAVKPNRRMSKLEQLRPVLVANKRSPLYKSGKFLCGNETSFFFSDDKVFCCGNNSVGQMGILSDSTFQKREIKLPTEKEISDEKSANETKHTDFVPSSSKRTSRKNDEEKERKRIKMNQEKEFIDQIACGETHSLFLTNMGNLFGAGNNDFGQLSVNGTPTSHEKGSLVFLLKNVQEVRANGFFSYVKINGDWHSFGFNSSGELGRGNDESEELDHDKEDQKIEQVAAFRDFSVQDVKLGHDFVIMTGSKINR